MRDTAKTITFDFDFRYPAKDGGYEVSNTITVCEPGFKDRGVFRRMGGASGFNATGEACIQYLCMTEDDIVRLKGKGKCNPPFRSAAEVETTARAMAARISEHMRDCAYRYSSELARERGAAIVTDDSALAHVADLEVRMKEMDAMKRTLERLAECCHGDHRPDCPILDELAD